MDFIDMYTNKISSNAGICPHKAKAPTGFHRQGQLLVIHSRSFLCVKCESQRGNSPWLDSRFIIVAVVNSTRNRIADFKRLARPAWCYRQGYCSSSAPPAG